ncbi:LysM peptidoglycan-binding domain-containing protein [Streptacidiphilus cavernicola]|uniref:LysM peptidoglycan-binding domain-containing protein n=1 Tax=Streptacidiphilus cavernicola TaxID=3342716 RepID=A0ABV6W0N5_9ACTN
MLRNLCRGLAALAALALLLVGLPAVLAVGTLAVTRNADPQHSDLVDLLTRPDNGNLFLWTLVVVGWIGWLCFAGSVLVEIPAQLRGRSARRVFALGWSQRMAGGLVGAVLALLPTAGAALAASPAAATTTVGLHPPVAAVARAEAGPVAGPVAVGRPGTVRTPAQPTYRVREERPAESLWSIAEKELGSGARWKEIARLNQGRTMDAGGRRFDADQPIHPGWVLLMPADAASAGDAAGRTAQTGSQQAADGHRTQVVVKAGDTLSGLAQEDMGNADRWPELFAANKGVRAPDGVRLEDPNLIEPGMVLTVPQAGSAPPVTPPAAPPVTPPSGTASGPPSGSAPVTGTPTTGTPSHAPSAGPQPTGTHGGAPASGAAHPSHPVPTQAAPSQHVPATVPAVPPAAPPTQAAAPAPTHTGSASSASSGVEEGLIGGTALLAAVVLGAVAVRRAGRPRNPAQRRQAQHRPRTDPRQTGAALPASLLEPVPPPFAALRGRAAEPEPAPPVEPAAADEASVADEVSAPVNEPGIAFLAAMSARQDAIGLDLLDRALRSLARTAAAEGRRLPALTVVRITPAHTVELHLATPAPPIEPFRAAHASTVWWCPADSDQVLPARDAAAVPAPYPALVSLGTAAEGSIVLVDLEAVRLVHLSGAPKAVTEVLRTLALELAFTPLADQVTVHTVGVAEELEPAAEGRLRVHDSLREAVAAVSARDHEVRTALAEAGANTPREARSRGAAGAAWAPEIVLCATVPDGTMPEELGRMLDASPRGSVAVVASAPPPGAGPMARWTLPTTGPATLPGLGMSVELQHLNDHQYLQWLGLLGTAPIVPEVLEEPDEFAAAPPRGGGGGQTAGPSSVPPGLAARPEPRPEPHLESGPESRPEPRLESRPEPPAGARPDPRFDIAPALDPWAVRSPWPDPASVENQDAAESVEAAHELTLRRLRAGDHQGAEAAAFAGLSPAPDTELLHRDLLCVYADAGATEQLHKAVHRLERLAARNGRALEPETDALIAELRGTGGAA